MRHFTKSDPLLTHIGHKIIFYIIHIKTKYHSKRYKRCISRKPLRDGLRKVLKEYSKKESIEAAAQQYKKGKISIREAAELTGLTLRETLDEFGKKNVYIHYGKEELDEDTA